MAEQKQMPDFAKPVKNKPPTCPQCGSLLSAVTWECVRGPYCKRADALRRATGAEG